MDNAAGHVDLIRIVTIVAFVCGIAAGLICAVAGESRGRATSPDDVTGWRIDDLLVCGVIGDCVLFVAITPNDNGNYARYLTAGIIFGVILTARMAGRLADRAPRPLALSAAAACCAVPRSSPGSRSPATSGCPWPPSPTSPSPVSSRHTTSTRPGDYWSRVAHLGRERQPRPGPARHPRSPDEARPLRATERGELVPGGRLHLLGLRPRPSVAERRRDDGDRDLRATGGEAVEGTYRILVWDHPIYVSTIGFSNK